MQRRQQIRTFPENEAARSNPSSRMWCERPKQHEMLKKGHRPDSLFLSGKNVSSLKSGNSGFSGFISIRNDLKQTGENLC